VDDFFYTGSNDVETEKEIHIMRTEQYVEGKGTKVEFTETIKNPDAALGMKIKYDKDKHTVHLSMEERIKEMAELYLSEEERGKEITTPLDKDRYIIKEEDFESIDYKFGDDHRKLEQKEVREYLQMVGSLLWVSGVRHDFSLAMAHLTWYNHAPRVHHIKCAKRVIQYLLSTITVPLVLGGMEHQQIIGMSDASLATGKKGRSIIGTLVRLSVLAGAIRAKCRSTDYVSLSSMECELNGYFDLFKVTARIDNLINEIDPNLVDNTRLIQGDNEKGTQHIKGEVEGSGMKHARMRMYFMQEEYAKGRVEVEWVSGKTLVCDAMTKVVTIAKHQEHREDIQGFGLVR
jgi:hypothetical protein